VNLTDGLRVRGRPTRSITARSNSPNCVKEAYDEDPDLATLIAAPYFRSSVESAIDGWRREVATATQLGIPTPASPRRCPATTPSTERLPAALTQGLRDFFGAHTYRVDDEPEVSSASSRRWCYPVTS